MCFKVGDIFVDRIVLEFFFLLVFDNFFLIESFFIFNCIICLLIVFNLIGLEVIFIFNWVVVLFIKLIVLFGKKWLEIYWLDKVVVVIKAVLVIFILWWVL